MSEGPSAFDPRYDVRYQRGYVPPLDEPVEPMTTDASAAHRATGRRPAEAADATSTASRSPAATESTSSRSTGAGAAGEPQPTEASVTGPAEAGHPAIRPVPDHGTDDVAPTRPAAPSGERPAVREAGPASSARTVAARWLWLVLGAGVAFVLAGTAMYWSVVSRQNPFESSAGARDTTIDQIVVSLAPAVVQAGVLGVVGALLAWALLGAGAADRDRARP